MYPKAPGSSVISARLFFIRLFTRSGFATKITERKNQKTEEVESLPKLH